MKPSSGSDANASKPMPTVKQVDEAFDTLAAFLFEQYRKYKEEV